MKILVIRLTSMGDVILTTPLFSFLKIRYPDSSITFITDPAYEELFSGDPRLVKVIAFRKNGTIDDSLLKTEWDLVIDLQNNHRSAF